MRTNEQNHGFIPDEVTPDQWKFGAIPYKEINVFGQWDVYLPDKELQKRNGLETQNCTSYGTLNCVETLLNKLFGRKHDYSERFLGVIAGTSRSGNSPHKVAEAIRKNGCVDEIVLPFDSSINEWDEYYSPNPMTDKYLDDGKKWLETYDFSHEWLFVGDYSGNRQKTLIDALKRSPVGVSVYAWQWDDRGMFVNPDKRLDTHWCMLYGYEEGKYWKVFDQYKNDRKKLDWNYPFGFAKAFHIEKAKKKECPLLKKLYELFNIKR